MMDILFDTHMLLWWLADDTRLSSKARGLIADPQNTLIVSAATGWEIAIKQRLGKLRMHGTLLTALDDEGFNVLPITLHHAEETRTLPDIHRDPFDRMLVAQSRLENIALLTVDPRIVRYPTNVIEG
jgi:PIN domain nuclease of toxin-antitoxin system